MHTTVVVHLVVAGTTMCRAVSRLIKRLGLIEREGLVVRPIVFDSAASSRSFFPEVYQHAFHEIDTDPKHVEIARSYPDAHAEANLLNNLVVPTAARQGRGFGKDEMRAANAMLCNPQPIREHIDQQRIRTRRELRGAGLPSGVLEEVCVVAAELTGSTGNAFMTLAPFLLPEWAFELPTYFFTSCPNRNVAEREIFAKYAAKFARAIDIIVAGDAGLIPGLRGRTCESMILVPTHLNPEVATPQDHVAEMALSLECFLSFFGSHEDAIVDCPPMDLWHEQGPEQARRRPFITLLRGCQKTLDAGAALERSQFAVRRELVNGLAASTPTSLKATALVKRWLGDIRNLVPLGCGIAEPWVLQATEGFNGRNVGAVEDYLIKAGVSMQRRLRSEASSIFSADDLARAVASNGAIPAARRDAEAGMDLLEQAAEALASTVAAAETQVKQAKGRSDDLPLVRAQNLARGVITLRAAEVAREALGSLRKSLEACERALRDVERVVEDPTEPAAVDVEISMENLLTPGRVEHVIEGELELARAPATRNRLLEQLIAAALRGGDDLGQTVDDVCTGILGQLHHYDAADWASQLFSSYSDRSALLRQVDEDLAMPSLHPILGQPDRQHFWLMADATAGRFADQVAEAVDPRLNHTGDQPVERLTGPSRLLFCKLLMALRPGVLKEFDQWREEYRALGGADRVGSIRGQHVPEVETIRLPEPPPMRRIRRRDVYSTMDVDPAATAEATDRARERVNGHRLAESWFERRFREELNHLSAPRRAAALDQAEA